MLSFQKIFFSDIFLNCAEVTASTGTEYDDTVK